MAPDSPEWFRLGPDAPAQKLFLINAPQQAVFLLRITLDWSGLLWSTLDHQDRRRSTEDGSLADLKMEGNLGGCYVNKTQAIPP